MKRFAQLYFELDNNTAALAKRKAIVEYLSQSDPVDAIWGLYFLCGGKINTGKTRIATNVELREWVGDITGYAPWLIDECYDAVGDLAETLSLLIGDSTSSMENINLAGLIEDILLPLSKGYSRSESDRPTNGDPQSRRQTIIDCWIGLNTQERFVFNKLLTGALRVGVSSRTAQSALAEVSGVDISRIAQRMLGPWEPTPEFWNYLTSNDLDSSRDLQQPYPFYLASPLEGDASMLGLPEDWQAEWKWDGIRLQFIKREGGVALWSRGEERLDGRFPEIEEAGIHLPNCVLDGELVAWNTATNTPLPFISLQRRIQRRKPSEKLISELPARIITYDILELDGIDIRDKPLSERRKSLEEIIAFGQTDVFQISESIRFGSWNELMSSRDSARVRGTEGLMLKRLNSMYKVGRKRGDWWKWKIDPFTIDAVLIYAQPGHGRRSTLYTDYTFAVWNAEGTLVPIAKAYSGLTDKEILELDGWIRKNTVDRFGPVRSVKPFHVFEIAFEAVNRSSRHKSGVAVRFPRIVRWRKDKQIVDADRLESLISLAQ